MACNLVLSVSATPAGPLTMAVGGTLTVTASFTDDGGAEPCAQHILLAKAVYGGSTWSVVDGGDDTTSGVPVILTHTPTEGHYHYKVVCQYNDEGWIGGIPQGMTDLEHDSALIEVRVVQIDQLENLEIIIEPGSSAEMNVQVEPRSKVIAIESRAHTIPVEPRVLDVPIGER